MINPLSRVLDTYAGLSHNPQMGDGATAPTQLLAHPWTGATNQRRLHAYSLLNAYIRNVARWYVTFEDEDTRRTHREYGDPALIVQQIRSAILGGEPRPLVQGADGTLPDEPTPDDVIEGGPSFDVLHAEWEQARADVERAVERQEWFNDQFDRERAAQKIVSAETHAVGLGDAVYWLSWSNTKQRVRLRIYEPGFYFPAPSVDDDDFPTRVHLAWEELDDNGNKRVRRITHELVELPEPRTYPYAPDTPSTVTCVLTDASWAYDDLAGRKVNDFNLRKATINENADGDPLDHYDLGIDFIPIVHIPNTAEESAGAMFGESALTRVAQLFDDIARNDTDIARTAAVLGAPILAVEGLTNEQAAELEVEPGMIVGGKLTVVDTSHSLDTLLKRSEWLLQRMSVVRQIPESILGKLKPSEVPSGIALMLSFGPFKQMIDDYRLVRRSKYQLLFKAWQRLAVVGGQLDDVIPTDLAFGGFLPTDIQSVLTIVLELVRTGVISKATALRMLQEAGLAVDDVAAEIDAARREDFTGAQLLADALQTEDPAWEYLGLTPPDQQPPITGPTPPGSVDTPT